MTRKTLLYFLLLTVCLGLAGPGQAAQGLVGEQNGPGASAPNEWSAGIGFAAEYDDNVKETASNRKADFITHVKPQFKLLREGGRVRTDISYRGDYRYYANGNEPDDYSHYLKASLLGEVWENLFFINIIEDLQPVYRDATRGDVMESDSTRDLVNRNRFTATPYFRLQPSDRTTLAIGYSFTDTRYNEDRDARSSFFPSRKEEFSYNSRKNQQHSLFVDADHEITDKLSCNMGVDMLFRTADEERDESGSTLSRYQAYVGGRYEASEDLTLSARAGPAYSSRKNGDARLRPLLKASMVYTPGRTEFALEYSTDYEDDPDTGESLRRQTYSASAARTFDRARLRLGLSHNRYAQEIGESSDDNSEKKALRPFLFFDYDLSERLTFTARYYANIYENSSSGETVHFVSYGPKYLLDEDIWVGLTHSVKTGDPRGERSYYVNKVNVELYVGF